MGDRDRRARPSARRPARCAPARRRVGSVDVGPLVVDEPVAAAADEQPPVRGLLRVVVAPAPVDRAGHHRRGHRRGGEHLQPRGAHPAGRATAAAAAAGRPPRRRPRRTTRRRRARVHRARLDPRHRACARTAGPRSPSRDARATARTRRVDRGVVGQEDPAPERPVVGLDRDAVRAQGIGVGRDSRRPRARGRRASAASSGSPGSPASRIDPTRRTAPGGSSDSRASISASVARYSVDGADGPHAAIASCRNSAGPPSRNPPLRPAAPAATRPASTPTTDSPRSTAAPHRGEAGPAEPDHADVGGDVPVAAAAVPARPRRAGRRPTRRTSTATAPWTGTPSSARAAGWPSTLARVAGLDDHAAVHEHQLVADLAGEADLVRHDDHRHAVDGEVAHHLEHLADQLRVERGGRLVEQHELRLHGQRPGDGDALLLAARQLVRVGALPCRPARPARAARRACRAGRCARLPAAPGPAPR